MTPSGPHTYHAVDPEQAPVSRPVAVVGAQEGFHCSIPNVVVTALSPDTAIRSGFDVFLLRTPRARREAQELIFLAEEAGVRIGLPRNLRRGVATSGPHQLVTIAAGIRCPLPQLVDLGLWLAGSPGIQRLEALSVGESTGLSCRAHSGALITIQRTPSVKDVRVFLAGGPDETRHRLPWDALAAREDELSRFVDSGVSGEVSWVSLEDSLEVVSVLERVHARVR